MNIFKGNKMDNSEFRILFDKLYTKFLPKGEDIFDNLDILRAITDLCGIIQVLFKKNNLSVNEKNVTDFFNKKISFKTGHIVYRDVEQILRNLKLVKKDPDKYTIMLLRAICSLWRDVVVDDLDINVNHERIIREHISKKSQEMNNLKYQANRQLTAKVRTYYAEYQQKCQEDGIKAKRVNFVHEYYDRIIQTAREMNFKFYPTDAEDMSYISFKKKYKNHCYQEECMERNILKWIKN